MTTALAKRTDFGEVATEQPADRLIALALEKQADPGTLEKLMALQERWEANTARKAYVVAMTAFKQEAPAVMVRGDKANFGEGKASYTYANLGSIVQEISSLLGKFELSASWQTGQDDKGQVVVSCHITHSAGHRETVTLRGPADTSGSKNPIQAIGSTVTYLQRYTLLAALGLATSDQDDDGHGAGKPKENILDRFKDHTPDPAAKEHAGDERKPLSEMHTKLFELMKAECNGDKACMQSLLVELTTWTDKDDKEHAGKNSLYDISDKMAKVAYGKMKKRIEEKPIPDSIKCTQDHKTCDHSFYDNEKALCGDKQPGDLGPCRFQ